ncbi:MAG: hypothetical protein ACYDB9_00925 [Gammaproteobacteria bacterium]
MRQEPLAHDAPIPAVRILAGRGRLYLSDRRAHKIIEMTHAGCVLRYFGCGRPGLMDGDSASTAFRQPGGLAADDERLYIADIANHAIRSLHLASGRVTTLAGYGAAAGVREFYSQMPQAMGLHTPLDVARDGETIYIAMAGWRQIWALTKTAIGRCAGCGRTERIDADLLEAAFIAPVAVAVHECCLYVADSGAAALRLVDLNLRRVTTLARAASGKGYWRPVDLALDAPSGRLYFTSTEDAVVRWLDLKSGRIHVLPGMLAPSLASSLSLTGDTLWMASRGGHLICRNMQTGHCATLQLHDEQNAGDQV